MVTLHSSSGIGTAMNADIGELLIIIGILKMVKSILVIFAVMISTGHFDYRVGNLFREYGVQFIVDGLLVFVGFNVWTSSYWGIHGSYEFGCGLGAGVDQFVGCRFGLDAV